MNLKEKEVRSSSSESPQRAFHSRIKVPFAQQIPYVDSNNRREFINPIESNRNQQLITQRQPEISNNFPQVHSGRWEQRNDGISAVGKIPQKIKLY